MILTHEQTMHQMFKCHYLKCKVICESGVQKQQHITEVHYQGYQDYLTRHTFTCKICDKVVKLRSNFRKHVYECQELSPAEVDRIKEQRNAVKEFRCDWPSCNYSGSTQANLDCHKRSQHSKKIFSCDKCSYQTNIKGSLKQHYATHSEILLQCSFDNCNYESNTISNLRVHEHRVHSLFRCDKSDCKKEFKTKEEKAYHIKNDHYAGIASMDDDDLICKYCEKVYTSNESSIIT